MPENQNPQCPDLTSHYENAREQLGIHADENGRVTAEQDEAILALADAEYRCCEGH